MLVFAHLRIVARTSDDIGGVPPHAAHGQAALPQVVVPGQQQCILLRRHGGQRQIVIAIFNGCGSLGGIGFESRRVPLLGKRNGLVGADAAAHRTLVLPDSLILVVLIHCPGNGVAS